VPGLPLNIRLLSAKGNEVPGGLCPGSGRSTCRVVPLYRYGLHITNYKDRTINAFAVDAQQVSIIGVFYGGQDYETALQDDLDDNR